MDIEGTYTLQALPDAVWHNLMNAQVLLTTVPGIERLEKIAENTYEVTLHIKHAPLKGVYQGRITITEQQFPYHYRIEIQGEGRQITFTGSGSVHLNGQNESTIIAYKGNITQDKRSSHLPPAVLKGAAKLLIQQFFTTLAVQMRSQAAMSGVAAEAPMTSANGTDAIGTIVVLPAQETQARPSILQTLIHWSKLGGGEPLQEALWATRIRRFGAIAGFLLLVWIGTRIPRKH